MSAGDPESGDTGSATAPLLSGGQAHFANIGPVDLASRKYGCYDRLFLKHLNPRFGSDVQLAVRAAVVVVVIGLQSPLVPGTTLKLFGPGAVVMFSFTVWKSFGETAFWAWCAIVGHVLAALDMYLMFFLFPEGNLTAAVLNGVFFTTAVLWLDLSELTQQFAMSNYVLYLMAFMTGKPAGIHQNLVWAVFGSTLAVLATLVPYPLWAINQAREESLVAVAGLTELWTDIIDVFISTEKDELAGADIKRNMRSFRKVMGQMDGHIKASWYECFGFTSRQRVRVMLQELDRKCVEVWERLKVLEHVLHMNEFDSTHGELARRVRPQILQLRQQSLDLFAASRKVAVAGYATAAQSEELRVAADAVHEACKAYTVQHRAAKEAVARGGAEQLHDQLVLQDTFGLNVCALARIFAEYGRFVALEAREGRTVPTMNELFSNWGFFAVFNRKVLFRRDHLRASFLNGASIMAGFGIGYAGYAGIFPSGDAGISATIALLMSKAGVSGSTLKKNLDRIQGVVLGTVVGQLGDALFRDCDFYDQIGLGSVVFVWVGVTLFTRYHSPSYSMVGKLLAAFGAKTMISSCQGGTAAIGEKYNPLPGYYTIVNNCLSVFVIVMVEFCLFHERSSDRACDELFVAWDLLTEEIHFNFSAEVTQSLEEEAQPEDSAPKLIAVAGLSREAAVEPRFWRVPWRAEKYAEVVEALQDMDNCLHAALLSVTLVQDTAVSGTMRPNAVDLMQMTMQTEEWTHMRDTILANMAATRGYMGFFEHESSSTMPLLTDKKKRCNPESLAKLRSSLIASIGKAGVIRPRNAATLEHDAAARLSVLFCVADIFECSLKNIIHVIRKG